jgi:hypothetical protein
MKQEKTLFLDDFWYIKNENGWSLGYRGSSSELYFSPHTAPISFPNEELAKDFIKRNKAKNPFIQKGVATKD